MHEHSSNPSNSLRPPDLPPCCGTGCAVCVLDLADEYAPPASTQGACQQGLPKVLPVCCNTGCSICVRDYPELFRQGRPDEAQMLALLEAMEAAERSLS